MQGAGLIRCVLVRIDGVIFPTCRDRSGRHVLIRISEPCSVATNHPTTGAAGLTNASSSFPGEQGRQLKRFGKQYCRNGHGPACGLVHHEAALEPNTP